MRKPHYHNAGYVYDTNNTRMDELSTVHAKMVSQPVRNSSVTTLLFLVR